MPERLSASEVHDLLHAKLDALLQECETAAENAQHGRTESKQCNNCKKKRTPMTHSRKR